MTIVTWKRRGGYEVSSVGDKRFSALNATFPNNIYNGRTIEQVYQCDIKGYQLGGYEWRLGKGKPPLNTNIDTWKEYLNLWRIWGFYNIDLMRELLIKSKEKDYILSDVFATSDINQARALAEVLNEFISNGKPSSPDIKLLFN